MATLTAGQDRERSAIGEQYKWNLADIYPDVAAWRATKETIVRQLPRLRDYEGRLDSSPQVLADALDESFRIDKEIARLSVYAGMLADQDTREAGPQGMQQEMQQLAADFKAQTSYVEPELLRIGLATLERCIEAADLLVLPARPGAPCKAYLVGQRRKDSGGCDAAGRVRSQHLQHSDERRFSISHHHA
jgi:hypothetical protein